MKAARKYKKYISFIKQEKRMFWYQQINLIRNIYNLWKPIRHNFYNTESINKWKYICDFSKMA